MAASVIELDGSVGEGGGQILRTSLALSLLTGTGFHLRSIRAGRARPGLQAQHLTSVRAAATIGQAQVYGAALNSVELAFEPGRVTGGKYHFAIGTAGATSLVLHTIYLPLALRSESPSEVTITGGTHVSTSPCFEFLASTWCAYLRCCGLEAGLKLLRRGFYPRGGGTLVAHLQPCARLRGLVLDDVGAPTTVTGISVVASLRPDIAERQARQARKRLERCGLEVDLQTEVSAGGPGSLLALTVNTTPAPTVFFALGERGKSAERVADDAVDQLIAYLQVRPARVDVHSADQLVLPLALANEPSRLAVSEISRHLVTNVAVIRQFLQRNIEVQGKIGQPGTVILT